MSAAMTGINPDDGMAQEGGPQARLPIKNRINAIDVSVNLFQSDISKTYLY